MSPKTWLTVGCADAFAVLWWCPGVGAGRCRLTPAVAQACISSSHETCRVCAMQHMHLWAKSATCQSMRCSFGAPSHKNRVWPVCGDLLGQSLQRRALNPQPAVTLLQALRAGVSALHVCHCTAVGLYNSLLCLLWLLWLARQRRLRAFAAHAASVGAPCAPRRVLTPGGQAEGGSHLIQTPTRCSFAAPPQHSCKLR